MLISKYSYIPAFVAVTATGYKTASAPSSSNIEIGFDSPA